MERENNINLEEVYKYRSKLIDCGKRVGLENPDRLSLDEIKALTSRVFEELNKIDMSMGFPHHDTGLRRPASVDKYSETELFIDFIDWYNILATPSNVILGYVQRNYPKNKYPRVMCVGDGEHCHLGRKLAGLGYTVVVVDPVSKKEFDISRQSNGGRLKVINGEFYENSEDMINWSSLIVGAKVPQCAEILTSIRSKPTVFNISNNAEVHNMSFNGKPIQSSKELEEAIEKIKSVQKECHTDSFGMKSYFYVCDQRTYGER